MTFEYPKTTIPNVLLPVKHSGKNNNIFFDSQFYQRKMVVGSNPAAVTSPSDFAPASSKESLDIQATIECGFTLKRVRDMIKTYSQMHRTDKYSQHSSIIWPAWLNG